MSETKAENQTKSLSISNGDAFFESAELSKKIESFKKDWYKAHQKVSHERTPAYDGSGKQIIKQRPDKKDYIEDFWMKDRLNKHFPGWSWEASAPLQFLGSEWVVAQGHLVIIDERLIAFGINPPVRKYYGVDSVRIQYKKEMPHTPENIVDVGDNCQSANTGALKRAINRLCGIGDDIYGKRAESEGAGTLEELMSNPGASIKGTDLASKSFNDLLTKHHILASEVFKILGIAKLSDIPDYAAAWETVKKAREITE